MATGKTHWIVPVFVAVIAGGFFVTGKYIENTDLDPVTVSVQGEGKVMVAPNIAEMNFGMQTERMATAAEAISDLEEKMNAVYKAIKALDIDEKDIKTQSLSMNPSYDWDEGERTLKGYEARQNLRVKIRDLDKIGEVLARATEAGANQAGGVTFTIDDTDELKTQARDEAIEEAEKKADELADQLGKRLGKLKGYSEGGVGMPVYRVQKADMMMAESMGIGGGGEVVPVPEGEQEIRITVTLMYELK